MTDATRFQCPNCDAQYRVVPVEAPPTPDAPLACVSCGGPLQSRDGEQALKYFRIDEKPRRARVRKG